MNGMGKAYMRQGMTVFAALLAAGLLVGCGETENKAVKPETVSGLRVQKIELKNVPDELEAPGTVIAAATAQVAARTTGTMLQVAVKEGDAVRRGQLLAQLDEGELVARKDAAHAGWQAAEAGISQVQKALAVAQANADVMQKTYDRYVYLQERKSVSPQEFDEISAKHQAAQAQLEQAKATLLQSQAAKEQAQAEVHIAECVANYARIVAPFDGRVVRRTVEPGSSVSPGMPLFVVEDTSRYQLQATLPTEALSFVKKGSVARVQLDVMTAKSLEGKVAEIEAGADPGSHTLNARIDLPRDVKVESGVFGRAYFAHGEKPALVVPLDVIVARGQLRGMYVVDAIGLVHWRLVTLGQSANGLVEVLSGVAAGDAVVLNPGVQELDGKKTAQLAVGGEEKSS
jgi:RND family efflux transporter MFP subunit